MSIIYDALQKTQANRDAIISGAPKKSRKRLKIILISLILSVFTISLISYFSTIAPSKKKLVKKIPKPPVVVKHVVPPLPQLTLNGFFLSDDESIAMINNRIMHVGDTIENMKVMSISENGVELGDSERHMVLKEIIIKTS